MNTFGDRLRTTIEVHHAMTLTEFSRRTDISLQNVSHYIGGQRKPGVEVLAEMVKTLPKADVRWLVTGEKV